MEHCRNLDNEGCMLIPQNAAASLHSLEDIFPTANLLKTLDLQSSVAFDIALLLAIFLSFDR
ncbi:hypothetical protein E4U58_003328 [Claviceps cyperi]|nr:hypothetical protein E4U58_003328 [Claviceps cyperi]